MNTNETLTELFNKGEKAYSAYLDKFTDNQIVGLPKTGSACPIAKYILDNTNLTKKDFYVAYSLVSVRGEEAFDLPAWAEWISSKTAATDYTRLSKKNLLKVIAV